MFRPLLMAAVAFVLGLSGCGALEVTGPEGPRHGWVEQAAVWVGGYDAAFDAGTGEHALFLAPDVVIDAGAVSEPEHVVGRARVLRVQREVYESPVQRGEVFISGSGLVRTEAWMRAAGAVEVLVSMTIGDDGITGCEYAVPLPRARDEDRAGVVGLLHSYEQAWRLDAGAVASLYRPHAVLTDSIRGIDVVGADDIAGLATTGVLHAGANSPRPALAAAAPYIHPHGSDGAVHVWTLQPGAGPCAADTMVALVLDSSGLILREHRYHALKVLASCIGLREPDDGWWVGRDAPQAFSDRVTGTVRGPAGPVEIRNGGPGWERVVDWSLDQFTRAGLPAPEVSVVVFDPLDPRCTGLYGLASSTPNATVLICVDAAGLNQNSSGHPTDTVPLWPTRLVLHELAHVWIDQHVDAPRRDQLLEDVGLASWDDPTSAWDQRGAEWAAETITWGLIDRVCTLTTLGTPPCQRLTEAFHTLTGAQPLTACTA